jgi:methionyl-tRNA formyltransferase
MRVAFAGTPDFALATLRAIKAAGHVVPLVLTQPDRPAGRGLKMQPSPVKRFAVENGIPLEQPRSLRLDGKFPADARAAQQALLDARAEALVVAAYGLLLPAWVLGLPGHGCLNVHASMLPRWRGAAPIQRAIEAGDRMSGVTIMQMDEGLDTGDMLLVRSLPIHADDTAATLQDRLAVLGAESIVMALARLQGGGLSREPQPTAGVTYARKIDKAEAPIRWADPAELIERRLRAFDPFPGATTFLGGEVLKCWHAELAGPAESSTAQGVPAGQIVDVRPAGILVACGTGALRLTELQRSGGKRLPVREFLAGREVRPGDRLVSVQD